MFGVRLLSSWLIALLGVRLYLRIPFGWRVRLGMTHGEDLRDLNALLRDLAKARTTCSKSPEGDGRSGDNSPAP